MSVDSPNQWLSFKGDFGGVRVYVSPHIPLSKTRRLPTSEYAEMTIETDVLCVRMGSHLYVHPERWPYFEAML